MPIACVSFEFPAPAPARDVLAWLAAAFQPAACTRAPAAWLGDDANPTFLGPADPLSRAGDHARLQVAFGPGGALSTSASYLVELRFAPTVAAGVASLRVFAPGADYQPREPWHALGDHDAALAQFQAAFAQQAGAAGLTHATRQSPAQAAAAGLALVTREADGAAWRVEMLRLIPAGHRAATEAGPPADTWVVRFSTPHDKEAMAVVHVDDASGTAVRV